MIQEHNVYIHILPYIGMLLLCSLCKHKEVNMTAIAEL